MALANPPVGVGFLVGLFLILIVANMCIVELPPYRFLHLATGIVAFGGFFVAGPAAIGILALAVKPTELIARWGRRVAGLDRGPLLGGMPQEYIVPSAATLVVLGVVATVVRWIGLDFPLQPAGA
ncbi:MAG: hypothetical protein L0221_00290, partial [Chloroflexi bacterium]|nr:hypothetical protein [Chloroflexota bacterium]